MPTLSMFYGILVRMYAEKGGQHNEPHIHAVFSGQEVVVSLDGNVLEGEIPRGKMKLLLAWMNWRLTGIFSVKGKLPLKSAHLNKGGYYEPTANPCETIR